MNVCLLSLLILSRARNNASRISPARKQRSCRRFPGNQGWWENVWCNYVSVNSNCVHRPLGNPRGFAQKKLFRGWDLTFKSCPGAGNSTRAGILWKVQTMLNAIYKCVLKRRFVFPVFNNFSETPCTKVGLDVRIPLIRVLSAGGWGEASPQTSHLRPPKKVSLKKNLNAISNVDLI